MMKNYFYTLLLCFWFGAAWAEAPIVEVPHQEGIALSPDSSIEEPKLLAMPESNRLDSMNTPGSQSTERMDLQGSIEKSNHSKPEVVLIPFTGINTPYSGKHDNDPVLMLKRGINLTQLRSKPEEEFVAVTTQQTVDRIQTYLAQVTEIKLSDCGVMSELQDPESTSTSGNHIAKPADYLYQVELGMTRLVISKSLFTTSLSGEAEAKITENNKITKRVLVDSYGGGKETLSKFGSDEAAADLEIKNATSKVVQFLANKLGDKLCRYFN